MKILISVFVAACAAASLSAPVGAQASPSPQATNADKTYALTIQAQPLADTLPELATKTGVSILFDPATVSGVKAPAIHGRYSARQALNVLLEHTSLEAHFTSASVVVVKPKATSSKHVPSNAKRAGAGTQQQRNTRTMGTILVIGKVPALSATRDNTPLRETPQTVSVISRRTLDQQNDTDLVSAMRWQPGVTVEQISSQSNVIESRGFSVAQIHVDGGAPLQITGSGTMPTLASLNLAKYNSIQVLEGSDALFGGMGNPSATLSLQRKKATDYFQSTFNASVGSWDHYGVVGDVSGPLNSKLDGRLVVAGSNENFFYDLANHKDRMIYGTLRYKFSPSVTLDLGGSRDSQHSVADTLGLPLYDNGHDPHLPRSLALTVPWATTKANDTEGFAELHARFSKNWKLQASASIHKRHVPENFNFGFFQSIDHTTNTIDGLANEADGELSSTQDDFSATLTGSFEWWGQQQRVMLGVDYQRGRTDLSNLIAPLLFGPPVNPFDYDPYTYPRPDFSDPDVVVSVTHSGDTQWGTYGAFRVKPTERLAITLGGRLSTYRGWSNGFVTAPYGTFPGPSTKYEEANKFTPYGGVTYDLSKHYTAYASFADIYHTNGALLDANHTQLPPSNGNTLEAGIKGAWHHGLLNGSFALFKVDENGVAQRDFTVRPSLNCCYVKGSVKSKGVTVQVTGYLATTWEITAGYTYTEKVPESSPRALEFTEQPPRNTFKLWTNYLLMARHVSLGGGIIAKSPSSFSECTAFAGSGCANFAYYGQGSYAVVDLRVAYLFNPEWKLALNVNNILDRTYYQQIGGLAGGSWYGAPRNYMLKLIGNF